MAAYFYSYNGNDVFKNGQGSSSIVSIDFLDGAITGGELAMYTSVRVGTVEITQFFPTFSTVIDYLHFGKGVGTVEVTGILFSDCSYNMPGLNSLYSAIAGARGNTVNVSLGSYSATAVVITSTVEVVGEPDTMANFSIGMNIISDSQ